MSSLIHLTSAFMTTAGTGDWRFETGEHNVAHEGSSTTHYFVVVAVPSGDVRVSYRLPLYIPFTWNVHARPLSRLPTYEYSKST